MASGTGKSKRKTKGKTLDLQSFLSADNPSAPEGYTAVPSISWATIMDDDDIPDSFGMVNDKPQVILPTAPKAARPPNIDLSKVPNNAPFKAHLANLPYDISEDDIVTFFRKLEIKEVQLPRDGGRLKGFGYAEFYDRDTLIDALNFNNETLKNRSIAVSLPSNDGSHEERRSFRQREDHRRDRDEQREDRTDENWRSQNQRPALNEQRFNSNRNGDFGSSRGGGGFDSERRGERNFDSERRFGDRRRDDRRQFGSSFGERRDRLSPTPSSEREIERSQDVPRERDAPRERKKLVLKPRSSKPDEIEKSEAAKASSNIFGEAKPVDTTAREREVEEKIAKKVEEGFERKGERTHRDSDTTDNADGSEGRRSRKVSESGSNHHADEQQQQHTQHEPKHIDLPPRRTFDEKPNFRRAGNFEHRDNRQQGRNRDYEHDSYRREGDGYGFKNRSRDGERYDSYSRNNRNNYSNDKYDSLDSRRNTNNKPGFGFNSNNRFRDSQQNRRDYGNGAENRNFSSNQRNNNYNNDHYEDNDEQSLSHNDESKPEYKSSNKYNLLATDVQDIDGACN